MTPQAALLGALIATICGLLYHLIRGGPLRRMSLFVVTSWIAFFAGNLVGNWIGWTALRFGTLNLLPALTGVALALIATDVLSQSSSSAVGPRDRRERDVEDEY
jgi:hypothetical protein